MSSQCVGKNIVNNKLETCNIFSNGKYCYDHNYKYRLDKPEECAICMEHISEQTETPLECGHWFHKSCLLQINKCPLCREELKQYELHYTSIIQEVLEISDMEIDHVEIQNDMEIDHVEIQNDMNEQNQRYERHLLLLNNLNIIQNITSEIMLNDSNNPYIIHSFYSYISSENYVRFLDYVHRFIETSINSVNISFRNLDLFETSRIASIILDNTYDNNLLAISFNILHYTDHNISDYYYMRIEQVIINRINEIYNL
jgi:hypothetical protein